MGYLKYKDERTGQYKFIQLDSDNAPRPIESVDQDLLRKLGIEFVPDDEVDKEKKARVKLGLSQDDLKFARGDD